MNNNNNNNNNNRVANFNNFRKQYNELVKRKVDPYNARKNEDNAWRENFESALGLKAGTINFNIKKPKEMSIVGPNYKSTENFFKALVNNNVNARKRLYKKIYGS